MLTMEDTGDRLVTVFTSGDSVTISLVKSILDDAHIPCVMAGEGLQNLIGAGVIGVGYNAVVGPVEVQVSVADADAARELLSDLPGTSEAGSDEAGEDGVGSADRVKGSEHRRMAWLVGIVIVVVLPMLWGAIR